MTEVTIAVDVPVSGGPPVDRDALALELRRLWLIEQVRTHALGIGKASELAGMPRVAFMQLLGAHGVPVIDYPVDDLERELALLDTL